MNDRRFPILRTHDLRGGLRNCPDSIPWSAIEPNEFQASNNHGGQTLAVLAARGGLGPDEAVAVLENRRWYAMDIPTSVARLLELTGMCAACGGSGHGPSSPTIKDNPK